jgi:16S rRNA (adenine1518-N6/adenine1519-N6)-dimethyltransferase
MPGGGGARVRGLLEGIGARPDKRLGQHFLVDDGLLMRQLEAASLGPDDIVLEVGAGLGTLTLELARVAGRVITYETDHRLATALRSRLPPNVDLRAEDALEATWPPFTKMVANIPYGISSPLLFKLLGSPFQLAVLMLQLEFAERLVARHGGKDYGRLTVSAARVCAVELLEVVPRTAFYPQPEVESALVRLVPREGFKVRDLALFEELLRVAFSQRRKMLRNSLAGARGRLAPRATQEAWDALLATAEWSSRRPEALSPPELAALADAVAALGDAQNLK